MGLLDFFKKSERVYIKEEDKYTGLIRYYECIINNKEANARILERCPKNAHIVDFELGKIHPIFIDAISRCKRDFKEKSRSLYGQFMVGLYQLDKIEQIDFVKKSYEEYLFFKNKLNEKCQSYGVSDEINEEEVFEKILDRIDEEERKESRKRGFENSSDVYVCRNKKTVENEVENQLKENFSTSKIVQARFELSNYYGSFIETFPWFYEILEKKRTTENEKLVLERYTEIFEALPTIVRTIAYLDSCIEKIEIAKSKKIRERYITRNCE